MANREILHMQNITKTYYLGDEAQTVLNVKNLSIYEGEFLSILGPSGSGKSTLMNIVGCLDTPTTGTYTLSGQLVDDLSEAELARIRNREIGFVFQSFHLLPRLSALQNVELPLIYAGVPEQKRKQKALAMLERVGLADKIKNLPSQMSGGQQQRVAIARAMVTEPTILLADEPTGALDQKTGHQIMNLFKELNAEGRTVVMITHNEEIAKQTSRIVRLLDGEIKEG